MCLQELKVDGQGLPRRARFAPPAITRWPRAKTYNGVAILARTEPTEVKKGIDDERATTRRLASSPPASDGLRVLSAYVPNGSVVGSDKWTYKLEWLQRLRAFSTGATTPSEPLVAVRRLQRRPRGARRAATPRSGRTRCSSTPRLAAALEASCGLRARATPCASTTQAAGLYSWWDYRMLGLPEEQRAAHRPHPRQRPLAARCAPRVHRPQRAQGKAAFRPCAGAGRVRVLGVVPGVRGNGAGGGYRKLSIIMRSGSRLVCRV